MYGAHRSEPNTDGPDGHGALLPAVLDADPNADLPIVSSPKAWVPMDDEHTLLISILRRARKGATHSTSKLKSTPGIRAEDSITCPTPPTGSGAGGPRRMPEMLQIDRDAPVQPDLLGYPQYRDADQAVTESMGPIVDHEKEHLRRAT